MYLPPYIHDLHGTAFPTNPFERQIFYRDDLHQLFYWNGTVWVASGGVVLPHHLTHELGGADQVMGTVPATPLALVHRDAAGRSQIANPAVNADIDNMGSRAAADAAHATQTAMGIHGSDVLATPNTLSHRDAAGRSQIANPAANPDIDNMGSRNAAIDVETAARAAADAAHAALTGLGIHGSSVLAAANSLIHRDGGGRSQIANPAVNADIDNMGSRAAAIAAINLYDLLYTCRFLVPWYANFTTATTGSASVTQQGWRAYLQTGTTINSIARLFGQYSGYNVVAANTPVYEVDFVFGAATAQQAQFGLTLSTDPTGVSGGFGIDVLDGAIRAFSSDGAARSTLDLATALNPGNYQTVKQLLVSGAVKTWIDGVAKADKTTNVPTTQSIRQWAVRLTNTAAANKTLGITTPKIAWKP